MAINLKAKETLQNVGDYKGNYRYVLGTEIYNRLSEQKVIQEAALRSGMSRGVMQAAWDAAGDVIRAWATEGHSVAIPGLGTMRLGVRAKSVATVNEVATGNHLTTRNLHPKHTNQARACRHFYQHHLLRPQRQDSEEGHLKRQRRRGGRRQQPGWRYHSKRWQPKRRLGGRWRHYHYHKA